MALLSEFELGGKKFTDCYFKVIGIAQINFLNKYTEIYVEIYRDKSKEGMAGTLTIPVENKEGTPMNEAYLEDGSIKPDMKPEDWHIQPIDDFDKFMATDEGDLKRKCYVFLKTLDLFKNAKDLI